MGRAENLFLLYEFESSDLNLTIFGGDTVFSARRDVVLNILRISGGWISDICLRGVNHNKIKRQRKIDVFQITRNYFNDNTIYKHTSTTVVE